MAGAVFGDVELSHLSWQAQHSVKFGMIARARNVVLFFNRNDGFILGSWSDHARIMAGSCSDRSRIVNDVSAVFEKFLGKFQESICVAGAAYW